MDSWYAVQTKPRAEDVARDNLARQGFRCLLPKLRRSARTPSGIRSRIESLFPRYLFIAADPTVHSLATIRSTRGCVGLVRFGGEAARVPMAVIENIRSRMAADDGIARLDAPDLVPGRPVRIVDGAFAGIEGVFRCRDGAERVRVLLDVLGRATEVVLPIEKLAVRI